MSKSINVGENSNPKGSIYIGEGVTVSGSFSIPGRAVVNGTLKGELSADELLVGEQGTLVGKITARNADIHGQTNDTLAVSNPPMARSNSPTLGHPKFPQAGRSDYDDSGVMAMRAAASLRR